MRKIIVTHKSPDMDAITSVWLLKRFLSSWEEANVIFVPAGQKMVGQYSHTGEVIEQVTLPNGDEAHVIHVDTGLGELDHHQTQDNNTCGASLTFEYVRNLPLTPISTDTKIEALEKLIQVVVDEDHFQEIYYANNLSYLYDFGFSRIIDGYKIVFPKDDEALTDFGMICLDSISHALEQKLWAEHELEEKGIEFDTKWGKAIGVESLNDRILEIAQKKGYVIAVRKDPKNNSVRIKTRPRKRGNDSGTYGTETLDVPDVDLTPAYEKIIKLDPEANWYLHVSKKMLLNGSSKNAEMKGSTLTLLQVIDVLKEI